MEQTFVLVLLSEYNPATLLASIKAETVKEALNKLGSRRCGDGFLTDQSNPSWTPFLPNGCETVLLMRTHKMMNKLQNMYPQGIAHVVDGEMVLSKASDLIDDDHYAFYLCELPELA